MSLSVSSHTSNLTSTLNKTFDRKTNESVRMADRQSTDRVQIITDRGITARKESLQAQTEEQSQLEKAHRGQTAAATTQLKIDVAALKLDFRQECIRARSEFLESLPPTEAS